MKYFTLIIFGFACLNIHAQTKGTSKTVIIKGVSVIDPMAKPTSYAPLLKSLEAPKPGSNSYHDFLNQQKIKSAKQFGTSKNKKNAVNNIQYGEAENPIITGEMAMRRYIKPIDLEGIYNGGTPLDNTMAVSSKYILGSVNSFLWGYDIENDSILFTDDKGSSRIITFAEFGKDYITDPNIEYPFDPKLIFIPQYDKFIFLFLSGRKPTDSKIIIGFSSTADPRDPWSVYMLPGNPRGLDQWSDFPMTAFDNTDLYLSINMLKANTSWQLGFKGSIVWQIPLNEGFNGDSTLNLTMYDDILYGGNNIRNLTPVQRFSSKNSITKGMTFLSDRNFDIQNDSLFIVKINRNEELTTYVRKLPQPYGMPPNGIQADDNPNDETDGLQTNDARFLAATSYQNSNGEQFTEFVGNTKNFANNRAGVYHGIIHGGHIEDESTSTISSKIISVDSLDFGYPNIVTFHNGENCYEGTFIAFNHTSATTFAGVSGIRHTNFNGYSDIIRLKEGENYVRRLSGSYERWGDYFGLQTVPFRPFEVWTAGFYGTTNKSSSTWFSKLTVTDSSQLNIKLTRDLEPYFTSNVTFHVDVTGANPPFQYLWTDGTTEPSITINLNNGMNSITVTDSKNCMVSQIANGPSPYQSTTELYPNPVTDMFYVVFNVEQSTTGSFSIYDITGKLIVNLGDQKILEGNNHFSFSTSPLQKGVYILLIQDSSGNNLIKKSFVKL